MGRDWSAVDRGRMKELKEMFDDVSEISIRYDLVNLRTDGSRVLLARLNSANIWEPYVLERDAVGTLGYIGELARVSDRV